MRPQFVDNDTLVFTDCKNQVVGVDTFGKVLFTNQAFAAHTEIFAITVSRDGRLFGALAYKSFCAASWFECLFDPIQGAVPDRVLVYVRSDGRQVYERRLAQDRKHPLGDLVLSPHGSLLAALYGVGSGRLDGIVEVFDLQE